MVGRVLGRLKYMEPTNWPAHPFVYFVVLYCHTLNQSNGGPVGIS